MRSRLRGRQQHKAAASENILRSFVYLRLTQRFNDSETTADAASERRAADGEEIIPAITGPTFCGKFTETRQGTAGLFFT